MHSIFAFVVGFFLDFFQIWVICCCCCCCFSFEWISRAFWIIIGLNVVDVGTANWIDLEKRMYALHNAKNVKQFQMTADGILCFLLFAINNQQQEDILIIIFRAKQSAVSLYYYFYQTSVFFSTLNWNTYSKKKRKTLCQA